MTTEPDEPDDCAKLREYLEEVHPGWWIDRSIRPGWMTLVDASGEPQLDAGGKLYQHTTCKGLLQQFGPENMGWLVSGKKPT